MASRREMPSAGGARFAAEGSEEAAEIKESVKVLSKDGNVAVAAMVWCLTGFRKLGMCRRNCEMAIFRGLA